jgi:hypothetical protein
MLLRALVCSIVLAGCTQPREIPGAVTEPSAVALPEAVREPAHGTAQPVDPGARPPGELAIGTFPIAITVPGATQAPDPADPSVVVVTGQCAVRVAEVRGASGAATRTRLTAEGATVRSEAITPERWALVYDRPRQPLPHSVELGIVQDGRTFVCRGDYADPATQVCAVLHCATLHPRP